MAALVGGHAGVAKLLLEKCGEGAQRCTRGARGGSRGQPPGREGIVRSERGAL